LIDKKLEERLRELERNHGYLNVELYDKHKGKDYPSSESIKKIYKLSLVEILKSLKIKNKEDYTIDKNRPISISNMKLLHLEHGEISKTLYDKAKLLPSSEYITKKYGWDELAKEANVKLANSQYISSDDVLKELKLVIKSIGYIPTSKEYESLRLKPSQEILRKHGHTFVEAMRKCGYRTYNKPVKVKDKVCIGKDCFRQFTPLEDEIYCDQCYKDLRSRLIKEIGNMSQQRLKDVCQKLIYAGNKQKTILDIFNNM
jgi:ribosomal protein L24